MVRRQNRMGGGGEEWQCVELGGSAMDVRRRGAEGVRSFGGALETFL
jgi:hypothetical protein